VDIKISELERELRPKPEPAANEPKVSEREIGSRTTQKKKISLNPKVRLFIGVASVIIFVPLCIMIGVNYSINNLFDLVTFTVTSSPTNTVSVTFTPQPVKTNTPSPLTQTSQPTKTNTPSSTQASISPTPIIAIIRASEGGGAFIRERPGGLVLATLGNGSTVTVIPNDLQEANNVTWVHVVAIVNDVHIEGWMIQTVLITATPSSANIISSKDDMTLVYVPAGEFTMGSDSNSTNEKPAHTVYLDAFWIDQTEVTNKMYELCVSVGRCKEPTSKSSSTYPDYYSNSEFDDYPVIYVDWIMAGTYCSWADRRLPTEAEWEKAARGDDSRTYPWGNAAPNNNLLNYNNSVGDTTKVGKYPNGASPYGALDMAGNVEEWVADWYDSSYYDKSPIFNPPGLASGTDRVLRGGAWDVSVISVRSAYRFGADPSVTNVFIGFRCAISETQ
jgi:formylglycine-generating enzyme required for sulfatase activity